jgi:hypothetical protein
MKTVATKKPKVKNPTSSTSRNNSKKPPTTLAEISPAIIILHSPGDGAELVDAVRALAKACPHTHVIVFTRGPLAVEHRGSVTCEHQPAPLAEAALRKAGAYVLGWDWNVADFAGMLRAHLSGFFDAELPANRRIADEDLDAVADRVDALRARWYKARTSDDGSIPWVPGFTFPAFADVLDHFDWWGRRMEEEIAHVRLGLRDPFAHGRELAASAMEIGRLATYLLNGDVVNEPPTGVPYFREPRSDLAMEIADMGQAIVAAPKRTARRAR